VQAPFQAYLRKLLPPDYVDDKWVALELTDETLDSWEAEVNGEKISRQLDEFLGHVLTQCGKWGVVFEMHFDPISGSHVLSVDECIYKLKNTLMRSSKREGFIAVTF
jgi:hypothetical protein